MLTLNRAIKAIGISGIRDFDTQVSQVPGIIKLTLGEPNFDTPEHIKSAAIDAIHNNLTHYEPNAGIYTLRESAANYYNEKFNLTYSANQVITTVGATEGILLSLMTILNPGETVVVPTPVFPVYLSDIQLLQGDILTVNTSQNDFVLTGDTLEHLILSNPEKQIKAVILVYPSNPTGTTYTKAQLEDLARVIKKYQLWAICDEIYAELLYEGTHVSMASLLPENTILLTGLSKSHAMTGWRIGFVMGPLSFIEQAIKAHQYLVTTPTSISQYAALQALTHGQNDASFMLEQYAKRRERLLTALTALGFSIPNPAGAFYLFAKYPEHIPLNDWEFAEKLAYDGRVAVVPGSAFGPGGEGHVRISYAASMENIEEAINRITQFMQQY